MGWQPIETAPTGSLGWVISAWIIPPHGARLIAWVGKGILGDAGWEFTETRGDVVSYPATHWMPIPPPREAAQ